MKVIIDIDEDVYRYIKDTPYLCNDSASIAARCIKNGAVLPKQGVAMLEFETIKELFKQSIDESDNMNEALQRLFDKVYDKGKEDAEKENETLAK